MGKYDALWVHVRRDGRTGFQLSFDEIEAILGFPIDHSFLNFKRELLQYGYRVGRITMKVKSVSFEKCE